jgi:hypothetical protein
MPHKINTETDALIVDLNPSDETTENYQISVPSLESRNDASPRNIESVPTTRANNCSSVTIVEPSDSDILCGRGGNINIHPGNIYFRKLVDSRKPAYVTARFKREKRTIAESILNDIKKKNGRFLTKNEAGEWLIFPDHKARDKTSQALREDAPKIRAKLQSTMDDRSSGALIKNSMVPLKDHASSGYQQHHAPIGYFCYRPNFEYMGQYQHYFDRLCGAPLNKHDSREEICEEASRSDNAMNQYNIDYEDYEDSYSSSNLHQEDAKSHPSRNSHHRMPPRDEKPIGTTMDSFKSNDEEMLSLRDSLSIDRVFNDSERTPAPLDIDMELNDDSSQKEKDRKSWSSLVTCGFFFPLVQELSDTPIESISMSDDDVDQNDLNGASLVKVFNASQEFGQRYSSNRSSGFMSLGDSFLNDLALDIKFSDDCNL